MKKNFHYPSQTVAFKCVSCNSTFEIASTVKQKEVAVDICGKCHPFYIGELTKQTVHGRAEKLSGKFNAGKAFLETKIQKKTKSKTDEYAKNRSLNDL